ncbi:sensor histidine kinase [Nonomuraea maritima]|uniref:sensor histidine kinase n=1 Tax=Nonomuraea maritima TaxID=683260 RepID=UPI00371A095B
MPDVGPLARTGTWAGFSDGRPPTVFQICFWGSVLVSALVVVAAGFQATDRITSDGLMLAFYVMSAVALPLVCLLWPLLPWQATAPARRKAVTVAFLASTLLLVAGGGVAALLVVGVVVGNALVVYGLRGGIAYACVTGLFSFTLGLLNPSQGVVASIVSGVVVLLLCLVILVVVVAMIEADRRAEETAVLLAKLEKAHAELRGYAERTRELAVGEERARIARDMHDSVGHYLTVINLGLSNAQRYRKRDPDQAWDEVRQAQRLTREALADTRRWVRALRPLRMDGKRGIEAVAALVESFGGADTAITFTPRGRWPDLDGDRELLCFRAVQEGLTNVLRHAKAGDVRVALDCTEAAVTITISDDGRGGDGDAWTDGAGLRGLRERAEAVNGTIETHTRPGEGFTLRVTVPAGRP